MSEPKTLTSQETKPVRKIDPQTQKHIDRFLQGKEVWNQWANEMLAKKKALEKAGKWRVKESYDDLGRVRTMSLNQISSETQKWLDEVFVDFSNLIFQASHIIDIEAFSEEYSENTLFPDNLIIVPGKHISFSEYIFPGEANFMNAVFDEDVIFKKSVFSENVNFKQAKFTKSVLFEKTKFLKVVDFKKVIFFNISIFREVLFEKFVGFGETVFEEVADFRKVTICDVVDFNNSIFKKVVFWTKVNFSKEANFLEVKFIEVADFRSVTFKKAGIFSQTVFQGSVDFRDVTFENRADFNDATFTKLAMFSGSTFRGLASFSEAIFMDISDFSKVNFMQGVYFLDSQFTNMADFSKSNFSKLACFSEVDFKSHANFSETNFNSLAQFDAILVNRAFDLSNTKFISTIPNFIQANFSESPRLDHIEVLPAPKIVSPFRWQRYFWQEKFIHFLLRLTYRLSVEYPKHLWNKFTNIRRNPDEEAHYRALKRLAIQAHDHENEMKFFTGEIRARRHITDFMWPWKKGFASSARYWAGVAYELFSDFGRSFIRPTLWWFACLWLFANLTLSGAGLVDKTKCHNSQLTPKEAAYTIGLKNSLLILGLTKTNIVKQAELCLYGKNKNGEVKWAPKPYDPKIKRTYQAKSAKVENTKTDIPFKAVVQGIAHSLLSLLFIFLLLLAIRNQFKIK